jgi:hypothetical protein
VARAIWPGDHCVFRFEQHLTIRASEQGAERLVATLARAPGERDSGPEMLEIRIGHVSTIPSPRNVRVGDQTDLHNNRSPVRRLWRPYPHS